MLKPHSGGNEGGGSYGIFDVFSGNQSDDHMLFFSVHGFSSIREVKKEYPPVYMPAAGQLPGGVGGAALYSPFLPSGGYTIF